MTKKESFVAGRLKSIGYAFNGTLLLLKNEASLKVQFAISLLVTAAGFFFNISTIEWLVQLLAMALVISLEGINTAIEQIADFIHPEFNTKIGVIKDIAAGAVFISSIFAIVIGLIIYLPKIF